MKYNKYDIPLLIACLDIETYQKTIHKVKLERPNSSSSGALKLDILSVKTTPYKNLSQTNKNLLYLPIECLDLKPSHELVKSPLIAGESFSHQQGSNATPNNTTKV